MSLLNTTYNRITRGVVTRATEPNLAPDMVPLAPEGSKLTMKLKYNVFLSPESMPLSESGLCVPPVLYRNYAINSLSIRGYTDLRKTRAAYTEMALSSRYRAVTPKFASKFTTCKTLGLIVAKNYEYTRYFF